MHTPQTLAQSALDAVGSPHVKVGEWDNTRAFAFRMARMRAIEYAVTATLEELDERSPADMELVLESILVLAR